MSDAPGPVVVVDRAGEERDRLVLAIAAEGGVPYPIEDAIDAIGEIARLEPRAVVVSDRVGAPGPTALRRLVRRKLPGTPTWLLGDGGSGRAGELSRGGDPAVLARAILGPPPAEEDDAPAPVERAPEPAPSGRPPPVSTSAPPPLSSRPPPPPRHAAARSEPPASLPPPSLPRPRPPSRGTIRAFPAAPVDVPQDGNRSVFPAASPSVPPPPPERSAGGTSSPPGRTTSEPPPLPKSVPPAAPKSEPPPMDDGGLPKLSRSEPPPPADGASAPTAKSEPPPAPLASRPSSRAPDPRLATIEPMVDHGEWARISELLGPAERASELPPRLALVYAIARKEAAPGASTSDADRLAIRAIAALLGVEEASATALVVAKRLLRRNPAAWRTASAPPRAASFLIVVAALVLGGLVGLVASPGTIRTALLELVHRWF